MSGLAVIVDYDSGNLHSAEKALARAGRAVGCEVRVSRRPDDVARADHLLLPGVGSFGGCMAGLSAIDGMIEALDARVRRDGRPFLGVCVGAQLMAETGLERGEHRGLGWIGGRVEPIRPREPRFKTPHMGWNALVEIAPHPVLDALGPRPYLYFVHSFHMIPTQATDRLALADHGGPVTAAVGGDTMLGVQFHPEKSQAVGGRLLEAFLRWRP